MEAIFSDITILIIGAVLTAIGFLLRPIFQTRQEKRKSRESALLRLKRLEALLDEAYGVFVTQNKQRNRLMKQLRLREEDILRSGVGYDETFYRLYDKMDEDERELFEIVRGMTRYSMHGVNERIRAWLEENSSVRDMLGRNSQEIEKLDKDLLQLRLHLSAWFAKYHAVFEGNAKRSLVYLNDEKRQGIGFPTSIANSLSNVISTCE